MTPVLAAFLLSVAASVGASEHLPSDGVPITGYSIPRAAVSGEAEDIGFLNDLNQDCKPADPRPMVEIATLPSHGTAKLVEGEDFPQFENERRQSECARRKSPGVRVRYQSDPGYSGPDVVEIRVTYASGATRVTSYKLDVWPSAEPAMHFQVFVATYLRPEIEGWKDPQRSKGLLLLDGCRQSADHFIEVWRHGDDRAIRALMSLEFGLSAAEFDRTVDLMKVSFGAVLSAKFRNEALVLTLGDSKEKLDRPYVHVAYAISTEKKSTDLFIDVSLARVGEDCRVTGFQYMTFGSNVPPWLQLPADRQRAHSD